MTMGSMTTWRMEMNMLTMFTSTIVPANSHVRRGVSRGAIIVDTVVIPTDRAKSPFDRYVMTLEAVPPGQHPTRITPMASSVGRCNRRVSIQANEGMMMNCAIQPKSISRGREKMTLKSVPFIVMPIQSMIAPSIQLM